MNRNIFIVVAVVFILAAGALYAGFKITAARRQKAAQATQVMRGEKKQKITGTWTDLLAQKKSISCTFTYADSQNNVLSSGKVYVDKGRMRADVETKTSPTSLTVATHVIQMDKTSYIWGMDDARGYKMTVTDEDMDSMKNYMPKSTGGKATGQLPADTNVDYDCGAWKVQESVFAVPPDVEFADMSAMMDQIPKLSPGVKTSTSEQCDACQMVPEGEARDACKKTLACP